MRYIIIISENPIRIICETSMQVSLCWQMFMFAVSLSRTAVYGAEGAVLELIQHCSLLFLSQTLLVGGGCDMKVTHCLTTALSCKKK